MPVQKLDRIGVTSVAKMYAAVTTAMSLVYAVPMLIFGSTVRFGFGFGMFLGIILFAAIGGFITGAIGAFVYNLVAGSVGGIELHLSTARGSGPAEQSRTQHSDPELD